MAVRGWLLDKSAAARSGYRGVAEQLAELAGSLFLCDLLIACTALHHDLGVVHVDRDFERIAEIRTLVVRPLA